MKAISKMSANFETMAKKIFHFGPCLFIVLGVSCGPSSNETKPLQNAKDMRNLDAGLSPKNVVPDGSVGEGLQLNSKNNRKFSRIKKRIKA